VGDDHARLRNPRVLVASGSLDLGSGISCKIAAKHTGLGQKKLQGVRNYRFQVSSVPEVRRHARPAAGY